MSDVTVVLSLAPAFAAFVVWLLRPWRQPSQASRLPNHGAVEGTLPKHYRFFPQIRQALSVRDGEYLHRTAPHMAKRVLRERRSVAIQFLSGLQEDFSSLERLARVVASLSPRISREQEIERLLLGMRFRLLYALVWLRLSTGIVPLQQIEHMTEIVGRLALRMEQAITQINTLSADRFPSSLNALH